MKAIVDLRALLGPAFLVLLLSFTGNGQNADEQQQIEKDVWMPLFEASDKFDAKGFLAVNSKDLVRIAVDRTVAFGYEEYARQIGEGFKRAKERGLERKSEARFTERRVAGEYAYETGYFRSDVKLADGIRQIRYSSFEFVLRKENGRWKILVDRDTFAGEPITEEGYLKATPMGSHSDKDNTNQMNTDKNKKAAGTFEVKMVPQADEVSSGKTGVGRMSLDKNFEGDLEGSCKGQMLTMMTGTEGSAGYVAIERFTGTLNGRKGTFAMQHNGLMNRGEPSLTISIVPDSGTEELTGISGKMTIKVEGGKHYYELEYSFPQQK